MSRSLCTYALLPSRDVETAMRLIADANIEDLVNNEYIEDTIIRPIMALDSLFQGTSGTVTLDPVFISTMVYLGNKDIKSLIRSAPVLPSTNLVLMPFRPNGNHWLLIAVHREGEWTILDSLKTSQHTKAKLFSIVKGCARIWFGTQPFPTFSECQTFQQLDSVSCGVHMATIAGLIMKGKTITEAAAYAFDAPAIRQQWAQAIFNYRERQEMGIEPASGSSDPDVEFLYERKVNKSEVKVDNLSNMEPILKTEDFGDFSTLRDLGPLSANSVESLYELTLLTVPWPPGLCPP